MSPKKGRPRDRAGFRARREKLWAHHRVAIAAGGVVVALVAFVHFGVRPVMSVVFLLNAVALLVVLRGMSREGAPAAVRAQMAGGAVLLAIAAIWSALR